MRRIKENQIYKHAAPMGLEMDRVSFYKYAAPTGLRRLIFDTTCILEIRRGWETSPAEIQAIFMRGQETEQLLPKFSET